MSGKRVSGKYVIIGLLGFTVVFALTLWWFQTTVKPSGKYVIIGLLGFTVVLGLELLEEDTGLEPP